MTYRIDGAYAPGTAQRAAWVEGWNSTYCGSPPNWHGCTLLDSAYSSGRIAAHMHKKETGRLEPRADY